MLKITIISFSYRKGIPEDSNNNNGGGYIFDCRCLPNPFHSEIHKHLNGKDKKIDDFFSVFPIVKSYIDLVASIVDISIKNYRERGFTELSIGFGCTGGQHRSVYIAEEITNYLNKTYSNNLIQIDIIHRENDFWH